MAIIGTLPTVQVQLVRPEHFAAAFAFIEEAGRVGSEVHRKLFALAAGGGERTELPGGAFALTQVYLTKPRAEGKWETHRAYIDVQAMILGEETMELGARERLTIKEDLTPAKDAIFYEPYEQGSVVRLAAGDVAIYFPPDAHMGSLVTTTTSLVRKVVVKVPVF